jgi:hypothetical protein
MLDAGCWVLVLDKVLGLTLSAHAHLSSHRQSLQAKLFLELPNGGLVFVYYLREVPTLLAGPCIPAPPPPGCRLD